MQSHGKGSWAGHDPGGVGDMKFQGGDVGGGGGNMDNSSDDFFLVHLGMQELLSRGPNPASVPVS